MTMQKGGSEGGRRGFISHSHACSWMATSGKPSARLSHPLWGLTHDLKLVTRQRFLRFSILKETPAAPQAFPVPPCPETPMVHESQFRDGGNMLNHLILSHNVVSR
jgi:hypothetical protein